MAATSPTRTTADRSATERETVADARTALEDAVDGVRRQAGVVGDRMPDMLDSVRSSALDGARTLQSWPEDRQRPVAAFSLGLGIGLAVAGAPRLAVLASVIPAVLVVSSMLGRERSTLGSTAS